MSLELSQNIKNAIDALTSDEKIVKALKFIEDDTENVIDMQCELALIPAPTFSEQKKAERMLEMFKAEGLEDCHIDGYGNCVGIRKGTGGGVTTIIEAHMDTVFSEDTKLEIVKKDGWIYCPGIVDDTKGCAAVLATVRALNAAGITTKGDIHFVGTVQEEGMGALRGMQYYVRHHPELGAAVSIDGPGYETVTYQATGIQTYEFNFYGTGGHAFGSYGDISNALGAAARFMVKLDDNRVPQKPKTSCAVTGCFAGSYASIHAIVQKATVLINFRSNSQEELEKVRAYVFSSAEAACKEETERWGKEKITFDYRHLVDVNANERDCHTPIVEAAYGLSQFLGCAEPRLEEGGSTNCSRSLEAGLPAVTLGGGGYDSRCHSIEERFMVKDSHKCSQYAMLLTLLCAGTEAAAPIV